MTRLPRFTNGELACSPRARVSKGQWTVTCDSHPDFRAVCTSGENINSVIKVHTREILARTQHPSLAPAAPLLAALVGFELQIRDRYTIALVHVCNNWEQEFREDFATDCDLIAVARVALEHDKECG